MQQQDIPDNTQDSIEQVLSGGRTGKLLKI